MISTADLLAAVKAAKGSSSVAALARDLDLPEKTVYRWSRGEHLPDDEGAARLALEAGLDPGEVVASIRAERATDPTMRALWASIAKRLHAAGATAVAVILSVSIGGGGDAAESGARPVASAPAVAWLAHFTSYTLARLLRTLAGSSPAAEWPIAPECCT